VNKNAIINELVDIAISKNTALNRVPSQSQDFLFCLLIFFLGTYALFGRYGINLNIFWFIGLMCVIQLFRNAMNAAEAGL